MSEHTKGRNAMAERVAFAIEGVIDPDSLRVIENMITFTAEGVTYNAIVSVARRQEGRHDLG